MARYMTIRVVDGAGRPKSGARVGVYIHRFLSSGFKPDQHTDNDGQVEFSFDDDSPITLYVDGREIRPGKRQPEAYLKLIV
jgi:hypothetical protein